MNKYLIGSAVGAVLGLMCLGAIGATVYYKKDLDAGNKINFPLLVGALAVSVVAVVGLSLYMLRKGQGKKGKVSPYVQTEEPRRPPSAALALEDIE